MLVHNITNVFYLAAGLFVAVILTRWIYRLIFSPLAAVPGPLYTRFTDLPYKFYSIQGKRVKWIHSLHQKYGPFVRVNPTEISISDLTATREIHRVSTPFLKSRWYSKFNPGAAPSLFVMVDPHLHRTRRSLLAAPLSENSLKSVEPKVNANVEKAMQGLRKEDRDSGAADLLKWFTYMATDIIGELTFGESFKMLDHVKPNRYFYDIKTFNNVGSYSTELGSIASVLALLRIPPFDDIVSAVIRFRDYSIQSIARYEKLVAQDPENPNPTLFVKLYPKLADGTLPREELVEEGSSYILAGSDTAAITSTYTVWNVCRDPAVRAKLLEELRTIPENFSWDDIRHLPYLNNVMQEGLRLNAAIPGSLKRAVPPSGAQLGPYTFPPGTEVSTQAHTLHRNPDIFPNPEVFSPERWNNPTPEMNQSFMAFSSGSRVCIGQHLARDEMRFALAKFFRNFPDAKILESDENMVQDAYYFMGPKGKRCLVDLGGGYSDLKTEKA